MAQWKEAPWPPLRNAVIAGLWHKKAPMLCRVFLCIYQEASSHPSKVEGMPCCKGQKGFHLLRAFL